jgi:hypothetical protein
MCVDQCAKKTYDHMLSPKKLCSVLLGYPNGVLFLCVVMGMGKVILKINKSHYI